MEIFNSIDFEEAKDKSLEWYKKQYLLMLIEDRERKAKKRESFNDYYSKNRERILQKGKERRDACKTSKRPRGRPRKYDYIVIDTYCEK